MKIEIIGTGNVGSHLARAFGECGVETTAVSSRTFAGHTEDADIYLIAVKDDLISETAKRLGIPGGIVAHTSGSVPINALEGCSDHTGVFYPAQTFSKEVAMNYSSIPFFIEGSDPDTGNILMEAAGMISRRVEKADSDRRRILHIAAVFACNFANHLWHLAGKIAASENIPFDCLRPLIRQSCDKIMTVSPQEAQTGPARRGDRKVIDSHLKALEDYPELRDIYSLLNDSISKTYDNECN